MSKSWVSISSLIALGSNPWCSSYYRSSMATLLFKFNWCTFNSCSSSLVILRWPLYSNWYSKTSIFYLKLTTTPMLFSLYWSSPYAFKMLVKDFRLSFSQFGSFWHAKRNLLVNLPCQFGKSILVVIGCAWIWGEIGSPN